MPSITKMLSDEHTHFVRLFDEVDRLLPDLRTVAEVRLLCRLVEGVLAHHADVEENLAYAAMDHVLQEKGELQRLYRDHQEIDTCFQRAREACDLTTALDLFRAGLKASRAHFRCEEETVFPLLNRLLAPATQEALGRAASVGASPVGVHGFASAPLISARRSG
jgi:hemerythrin-like domain-containing protein